MAKETVRGYLNPLQITFTGLRGQDFSKSTSVGALADLCADNELNLRLLCERAKEVDFPYLLNFVPDLEIVIKRLLPPVRAAKVNYILGHFISSIAMSALSCEMATSFHFEVACECFSIDGFNDALRKFMTRVEFDTVRQSERLETLRLLPFESKSFIENAEKVKVRRDAYLHVLKLNESRAKEDALNTYKYALQALDSFIGLHPSGEVKGALELNPGPLRSFMEARNLILRI